MGKQLKDYGAHVPGQAPPDLDLQQRAIKAAKTHPNYLKASSRAYCEPMVLIIEGEYLVEEKKRCHQIPATLDRIVEVCFTTSAQRRAHSGKTFHFYLHPESMEILLTTVGRWKR